ncbi:DUF5983 family protein [Paenibacillus chitinolyticus]|uniref:DUF5983 family protein n=1 Tax=Paenibacillus chitinolyticus TaxID=79263 RepID=UPI001C46DB8C|nr:hypothetical protein [Paenibacillus chitinolyticus]MBV6717156.1 hypothetical protein [Paenibacillus chitinolyticus]
MPEKNVTIFKMLDVSLGHVTADTVKLLDDCADSAKPIICYDKKLYGFFIVVPAEKELYDDVLKQVPDDLRRVFKLAKAYDCDWINLDTCGTVYPDLLFYEENIEQYPI